MSWPIFVAFLCWLPVTDAEPNESLVIPSIIPLNENPGAATSSETELGFSGTPADGEEKPPANDGSTPLPEAPDAFSDAAAFATDGSVEPPAETDPAAADNERAIGESGKPPNSEEARPVSDTADFSNDLGSPPERQGGLPSSQVMGGAARPSGFAESPGNMPLGGGMFDDLREGLDFAFSVIGAYDTNPTRGYGTAENSGEGDFFMGLAGTVNYLSRASTWTYGARYSGGYNQYFKLSELSGYNQNAKASLNYNGGLLTASLNVGIDFGSGANRYYESVVDQITYNYNLNARYRVSQKTSITGELAQSITSSSGDIDTQTESFDLGVSALWRYSKLTEFGPGIRYTMRSGDASQKRTSIGPTASVNYELSQKVSLGSRVGMDFAEYEDGTTADPSLYTSIALTYRASNLWGMNLSLLRDNQASYTNAGEFEQFLALRIGYVRKIRRAILGLGASWETRSTENETSTSTTDRKYLTLDSVITMPVFADTCNASLFMRYSDQSGDENQSWNSLLTGLSISRQF
jgi:hypothetical protein